MFAEGIRLVQEGVDAGAPVLAAMVSPRLREKELGEALKKRADEFFDVTDEVLSRASALETHQGVAVLFAQRRWEDEDLLKGPSGGKTKKAPLVLVAAGVRDPGNLGALLTLNLTDCTKLKALPASISQLTQLDEASRKRVEAILRGAFTAM